MPWRAAASMSLSSARPTMAVPFNVNWTGFGAARRQRVRDGGF